MQVKEPDRYTKFLTVRKSKTGLGVFADKNFLKGKIICELKGKLITCEIDDAIDTKTRNNAIRFNSKYYLSPDGEVGDYFNHSCDPNSYVFKKNNKIYLIAARNIKNKEEIRFDYSTITAADDIWKMRCFCQSPNCRGLVKSFDKLPKEIRDNYLSRKMVPSYIYRVIK